MTSSAPPVIYRPPSYCEQLDWGAVFATAQPIEIDLGCGRGAFLLQTAAARPEHNFLGVDRLLGRLRRVESKIQRRGLANVRLLRLEAGYFVRYLVPAGSVSVYHIYFPDPWPKRRHHDKRLFNPEFVCQLAATLQPAGTLQVATDHAEYFAELCALLKANGGFEGLPLPPALRVKTDFEQKFAAEGKPIYHAAWQKAAKG